MTDIHAIVYLLIFICITQLAQLGRHEFQRLLLWLVASGSIAVIFYALSKGAQP